jgi:two-component system chemotaxis response regulator CheY
MARILIVDDASFMRGSLKYSVEKDGHTVAGLAKDGVEAIEMYKKLKPDLVTMDILMNIRKSDPKAKVVMVTAMGLEEKEKEARDLGASGYIRKPFKHNEIMDTLKKVLG